VEVGGAPAAASPLASGFSEPIDYMKTTLLSPSCGRGPLGPVWLNVAESAVTPAHQLPLFHEMEERAGERRRFRTGYSHRGAETRRFGGTSFTSPKLHRPFASMKLGTRRARPSSGPTLNSQPSTLN
jgi:hypothetical protein